MKTYRTGNYGIKIEEFELIRETATTVWFKNTDWGASSYRAKKDAAYHKFHSTWKAARDYLLERAKKSVESKKALLEAARSELGQIESLATPRGGE